MKNSTDARDITVVQRHFVNNRESFEELNSIIERTVSAIGKVPFNLQVDASYKQCDVNFSSLLKMGKVLTDNGIRANFYKADSSDGPGTMISNGLFSERKGIRAIIDGTMYDINNQVICDAINHMASFLTKKRKIVAFGLRTNISLASPKSLNDLRNVYEMFLASFARMKFKNPFGLDLRGLNPAYRKFGDMFPGFYIFNHDAENAASFLKAFDELKSSVDFRGFTTDYYLSLKSYVLDKSLFGIFVPSSENISAKKRHPSEIEQLLKNDSRELLKTDIGEQLREHISDGKTSQTLAKYFDPSIVLKAKALLLNDDSR